MPYVTYITRLHALFQRDDFNILAGATCLILAHHGGPLLTVQRDLQIKVEFSAVTHPFGNTEGINGFFFTQVMDNPFAVAFGTPAGIHIRVIAMFLTVFNYTRLDLLFAGFGGNDRISIILRHGIRRKRLDLDRIRSIPASLIIDANFL